jgi:hypothetical protein
MVEVDMVEVDMAAMVEVRVRYYSIFGADI